MAGEVRVPVFVALKDDATAKLQSQLSGLSKSVKGFGSIVGKTVGAIGSFSAAIGAANFVGNSIEQAKNLERSLLSVDTVFGELAPKITSFAKSASNLGLSQSEAAKASVFLGSVLKQSGFSIGDTAVETEKLVKLAADLSTTFGYDVQEALMGMTALFRGEYDPIEKFGVAMKQSEINSELAARGLDKLEGAERRLAEQQIRLQLLYQRSTDAQGAFTRGAGTLYVETERLRANFENLQADLGAKLIPVLANLFEQLQPVITEAGPALEKIFGAIATVIQFLAETITELFDPTTNLGDSFLELGLQLESLLQTIFGFQNAEDVFNGIQEVLSFILDVIRNLLRAAEILTLSIQNLGAQVDALLRGDWDTLLNTDWSQQLASQIAITDAIIQQRLETEKLNRSLSKRLTLLDADVPIAFGFPGQMGFVDSGNGGGGGGGGGGAGAATESQFKKVQKIIKTYQDRLNKAEEQYLRQKFQLNRDYEDEVKKLREAETKAQEDLLKQSAKRLTDAFANISRATLGDLFSRETTTQLETRVTQLSSRLSLSVTREVQKTTNSTVGELINSLSEKIASARNLISAASNLAAKGFSQTFIEQVIETGADTGMALADAILTASPEQQEALKRNFLELETVSETGMDAVAKALTDKFGLATRELNAQSKLLKDELDDSLVEKQAQLIKALGDAAWAFSFSIKGIRDEFVSVINDLDGKFGGLGSTIDALLAKMAQLATVNITGPTNKLADATVSQVKVVKGAIDATGIVIDSASDIASTAAYIAERVAAANKYIKSSSSNKAQEASAMAQITDWTSQLRELQTAAKEGQNVSETVININVKTSSDQSVAMVGRTLGNTITKYVTTGGKVLVSGTK